jgi:hypothetical protein
MAAADYRSCDLCGTKAFYDANLGYEFEGDELFQGKKITKEMCAKYVGKPSAHFLYGLGDWAVLCTECSKTHKTAIVKL